MARAPAAARRRSGPRGGPGPEKKKKTKVKLHHDERRKLMSFLHNGRVYAAGHKWRKSEHRRERHTSKNGAGQRR